MRRWDPYDTGEPMDYGPAWLVLAFLWGTAVVLLGSWLIGSVLVAWAVGALFG